MKYGDTVLVCTEGNVGNVKDATVNCDTLCCEGHKLKVVHCMVYKWVLGTLCCDIHDQEYQNRECLYYSLVVKIPYLYYLSKLFHKNLDEDEYELAIDDNEFPEIQMRFVS